MKEEYTGIPVKVYTPDIDPREGSIVFSEDGPRIVLDDSTVLQGTIYSSFSVLEHLKSDNPLPVSHKEVIWLKPVIMTRMAYSPGLDNPDSMYPPSTGNWISKATGSNVNALYSVQEIKNNEKLLLTITSLISGQLVDAYLVQPYEVAILSMNRDWFVYNEINQLHSQTSEFDVLGILDEPAPTWSYLSKLVEDVTIPNLSLRKTMRETLDQLVPKSFPEKVREEIMAFLAWVGDAEIPSEDPADFIEKYSKTWITRNLISGHLMCMLSGVDPPSYARIMSMADQGLLKFTQRPLVEAAEQNPWHLAELKLYEEFPDWTERVINYTVTLNSKNKIAMKLPVSKAQALESKKMWSDRFVMNMQGVIMRGHVHKETIGLKSLVYIGGAHRWPHRHLEWSARLGYQTEKQPHIQVMTMPHSSIERISRVIPSIQIIDWDMSTVNLSLYNGEKRKWMLNLSTINKSLGRNRSFKQLKKEFGLWNGNRSVSIDEHQAKVLDMISWGLYLRYLESARYAEYYGIETHAIEETLNELLSKDVFSLQYLQVMQHTASLCIEASGPIDHVCSFARSFLLHSPSAHVRIGHEGAKCIIVARVPEGLVFDIISSIPKSAEENDVNVKIRPISAYVGYRNDMYQRLLKGDGIWDDDVSGLLSQVRLRSKNTED